MPQKKRKRHVKAWSLLFVVVHGFLVGPQVRRGNLTTPLFYAPHYRKQPEMISFYHIERLRRLHQLIEKECTGTPEEFAGSLRISRRLLYNLLEEFAVLGAKVHYSRPRKTFYFARPFIFKVHIDIRPMTDEELKNYNGGSFIFLLPCKDIARYSFLLCPL